MEEVGVTRTTTARRRRTFHSGAPLCEERGSRLRHAGTTEVRRLGCFIPPFVLLGAILLIGCSRNDDSILPVLKQHLQRYPDMQADDIYKLVHHAAMGNGHMFTDTAAARLWLLSEMDEISADTTEPLIEQVSPDGVIVRVNLRPYKARGGDIETLYRSMLRSAGLFRQDPAQLERWGREIIDESEFGTIPVDKTTLREFFDQMKSAGYPAKHHSETYEKLYAPSYRVLMRDLIPAVR